MSELAVQASNGFYTDSDREALNDEIQSLKEEIDRIGKTTMFNDQIVFKGKGVHGFEWF